MKSNYYIYILIIGIIFFRTSLLNLINNITSSLFLKNQNLETVILNQKAEYLTTEYQNLLNFKNNIDLKFDYTIANVIKNNYSFDGLIVNGDDYKVGDEVVNNDGLIGIISKINYQNSEVTYIYNSNIVVKISEETGKIVSKDQNQNLIIKEISNYNNIKINDLVYSVYGSLIGKVIDIKYETLDNYLTVKTINLGINNYVAVISR